MRCRTKHLIAISTIGLAAALSMQSTPAAAQDEQGQAALGRSLFDEGVALFNKRNYKAACPKFEASLEQYAGLGTRGKLAECYEKLGRFASAWRAYREVAELAMRAGDATRERVASERAKSLEPKLSYVKVIVPPGRDITGLVVKRGDREVEQAKIGSAEPVDPGPITMEVSAPGRKPFTAELTAAPGKSIDFEVPILVPTSVLAGAPDTAPPSPAAAPEQPLPVQSDPPSWQKPVGVVVAGVGVVGLGAAAIFGLSASSTYDGAFDGGGCERATKTCDARGQDAVDDAKSKATLSTVLFGAGGALVAIGTVVFLTAPSSKPRALRVAPSAFAGGGGITLGGAL